MTWLLYELFSIIDSIIYGVAEALFRIIFDLANVQFFTNDQIKAVTSRVYIVVGVLMLFKLVISAVQYLINPDAFEDKEKGLGGLLKKTAVSIGLIVIIPTVFQFLMAVQSPIIKTLPSVILGASPSETINDQSIGFDLSFEVLSTFIRPRDSRGSVSDAVGKTPGEIHDIGSFVVHVTDGCGGIWSLFGIGGSNCEYDYKILISTLAGGFLCYMLLGMTLDIAIRTIKMGIIQMLAPIPISSYIVNKDMLNKFVKTATSVYLDLFIRMGIVYFVIFAIQAILETGILGFGVFGGVKASNWFMSIVVNIILIFGLLMFASKAPKFITELLGLPDVGSGDIADMFKPAWQRAGGFAALNGSIGAGAANMLNYANNNAKGKNLREKLKNALKDKDMRKNMLKSGAAGASSAGFHGMVAAAQGKGSKDVYAAGFKRAVTARQNRELDQLSGLKGKEGLKTRAMVGVYDTLGLDTPVSLAESNIKAADAIQKDEAALKSQYISLLEKYGSKINVNSGKAYTSDFFGSLANTYGAEMLATGDKSIQDLAFRMANGKEVSYADLINLRNYISQNPNASAKLQALGGELANSSETMKAIQKSYMYESLSGHAAAMGGGVFDALNVQYDSRDGNIKNIADLDIDLADRLQGAFQDITTNEISLDGIQGAHGSKDLRTAFVRDFSKFSTESRQRGNDSRQELAANKEAAAREANKRRQDNKKNSS